MYKQFVVEYYHDSSRAKLSGTIGQALHGAQSETAVQMYLQQRHPGKVIKIMKLEWK